MYSLAKISSHFILQSFELYDSLLALVLIVSCAILASSCMSLMLQRKESPKRKAQKRLQALANMRADSIHDESCPQGADANTVKGIDINQKLANAFSQIMGELLTLPVLRVLVKPIVTRIEKKKVQTLRDSCMNDLPEMVDILSLSLGAGLSIDQAFEWYLSSYDTPLAGEFRRAEQAYQVGMLSRMKAFEQLAQSLQEEAVLRFVNALRQAFTLGSALGPALDTLSQDVRRYRVSRIEERIAKTPVKILAPLGLCIVPAVLILLMGPIMSQVLQGFQL